MENKEALQEKAESMINSGYGEVKQAGAAVLQAIALSEIAKAIAMLAEREKSK